ncbi:hypothetical protein MPSI1_003262 [Malassezia psittaci]|uniref:Mini-chromosome maintenance complex-binding protein n=1 Tax=Malassezia psittaci TaxID=1821823 RepID=A0AAF0JFP0_9BASI|nr:hypothetical protein MPSI1_003262 [Malassezia psittaci]
MVPTETDFLRALETPREVVQDIYARHYDPVNQRVDTSVVVSAVQTHFRDVFHDWERKARVRTALLTKIPILDASSSAQLTKQALSTQGRTHGVLVRWVCMIQDTGLGCEMYLGTLKSDGQVMCGLYGAESGWDHSAELSTSADLMAERLVVSAESIPGQSSWARRLLDGNKQEDMTSALNRLAIDPKNSECEGEQRKSCSDPSKITALLKFADVDHAEQLRTTELVEVIGLLDISNAPHSDLSLHSDPSAAVPEMICIHALRFGPTTHTQLLSPLLCNASLTLQSSHTSLKDVRAHLIRYFAKFLQGDTLAAEFLLLALIAKIHTRRPGVSVGSLSLNLSNIQNQPLMSINNTDSQQTHTNISEQLFQAIRCVAPAVVREELSLSSLNNPERSYFVRSTDTGISSAQLQLPPNTCVLVDETCMGEGQLEDMGVRNIRSLANLLENHSLSYQFPFSEMNLDTDQNVVIFSTGKTFLPVDIHLPLRAAELSAHVSMPEDSLDDLNAFRNYLLIAQASETSIDESMSVPIQDYFVDRRRNAPSFAFTELDLQRCINLARIVAKSFGHTQLNMESWHHAVQLEEERKQRLSP